MDGRRLGTAGVRRTSVALVVLALVVIGCGRVERGGATLSPSALTESPVASPIPPAGASPSIPPALVPPTITWSRVPLAPSVFEGAAVGLVVAGPDSLVAFGQETATLRPVTWTSRDGETWLRHPQAASVFGGGVPDAAIAGGPGWIALGYRTTYEGLRREIWTSANGVAWTRDPDPTGQRAIGSFARVGAIVLGALQGADGATSLVRTTDGLRWTDVRHPDLPIDATLLGAGLGHFYAVDQAGSGDLWRSADGIAWSTAERPGAVSTPGYFDENGSPLSDQGWVDAPVAMEEAADGLIVVWEGRNDCCSFPVQWHSADGRTWTQSTPWIDTVPNAVASYVRLATVGGRAVVQFVDPSDEPPDPESAPAEALQVETSLGSWLDVTAPDIDLRLAVELDGAVVVPGWDMTLGGWVVWRGVLEGAAASARDAAAADAETALPSVGAAAGVRGATGEDALAISPVNGHGPFGSLVELTTMQAVAAVPGGRFVMVGQTGDGLVSWVSGTGRRWMRGSVLPGSREACALPLTCGVVLAAGPRGAVAVSSGRAWFSRDGAAWSPVSAVPFRNGAPSAIVAGPKGFVGVGTVCPRGRCRAAAWTSTDGRRWTLRLRIEGGATATMSTITPSPTGFVAGGSHEVPDPDSDPAEEITTTRPLFWRSSDGVRWTLLGGLPVGDAFGSVRVIASLRAGGRGPLVAVIEDGSNLVSGDGRSWMAATGPEGFQPQSVVSVAGRFLAVGGDRAWTSADGRTWSAVAQPGQGPGLTRAASRGNVAVVLGSLESSRWVSTWLAAEPSAVLPSVVCPPVHPTALQYLALSARDRLACFGGRTITFSAHVNIPRGCGGGCGDDVEDGWWSYPEIMLAVSERGPTLASAVARGNMMDRVYRVLTDDPRGRQLTVSVRTDDPLCRRAPAVTPDTVRFEPIAQQVMSCRQAMVIVGVRR